MDTLALYRIKCNERQLETWITTAIDRSIRNLYLKRNFVSFPRSLFNCKTIVKLKLDFCGAPLSAVDSVSLPSLKKFHVSNVVCENDEALPHFLSGCPSLEVLNMAVIYEVYDYVGCINISSPTIKKLKLDLDDLPYSSNLKYRMIVNAPALRYLQVDGYFLECITNPTTMISLVEADINLQNWFSNCETDYNSTSKVVKFLHSLSYVKCLKISGWDFVEFIRRGLTRSNVKFDNLTKLELLLNFKKFHVSNIGCENDEALSRFLSGCPSLEELNMEFTSVEEGPLCYYYTGCINISSPTINTLKLDLDDLTCPSRNRYRMIINAPALRYLQVYGYDLECITIPITMISLVEADISLQNYCLANLETNYDSTVMEKLLHSLCYVKCLKISGWEFVEFVRRGLACSTVKFDNLTKLEVQWHFDGSLLVKFLKVADNLQVLICERVYLEKGYLCPEAEQVPKCLLSCLRTITFKSMYFSEYEFDMVRYLLGNSRVLERMELFTSPYGCHDLETKSQALKRISLFERGSSACQLAILPNC
ncbi:F-box/RNI-like/FBD-like domains-containing protein [Striga asiatica]|uniref:F-box/RNI-like/FBD-like domains-containing protein n=1 Tax=Striga asiatica TaxID=4170 RepID=A0A5A7QDN1_STRAF|nr:F-box/RNI-like/FBD-like domains-containing protein [Striga asiatica]